MIIIHKPKIMKHISHPTIIFWLKMPHGKFFKPWPYLNCVPMDNRLKIHDGVEFLRTNYTATMICSAR